MDIKLLQTFKKINMQSAMKVHDTAKGLVPTASSSNMHQSASGSNLRHEATFSNVSQFLAAKFVVDWICLSNVFFVCMNSLPEQTVPDLMYFESQGPEHYHDDAHMHHFLDTNLYRARPKV